MDERLRRLMALYGEGNAPLPSDPPSEPGLGAELDDWRELKTMMEARPRRAPRPESIAAILDAARRATAASHADDRAAVSRKGLVLRRIALAGAVTAVALSTWLVVGTQVSESPAVLTPTEMRVGEAPDPPVNSVPDGFVSEPGTAEQQLASVATSNLPPVVESSRPVTAVQATSAEAQEEGDGLFLVEEDLTWDQSDEVRAIYDHLEELYRVSPPGSQWRNASQQEVLTARVGLVTPQQAALYTGQ